MLVFLLSNSFKFTQEGFVSLSMSRRQNMLQCEVADSGCGIAEDEQPRLFSLLEYQRENQTNSGFGLAYCKQVVETMGGQI